MTISSSTRLSSGSSRSKISSIRSCEKHFYGTPLDPESKWSALPTFPQELVSAHRAAFTVGLLRALCAFRREHVTASSLAAEACEIEIEGLGRPVGKQDQYIAAFGGLTCMEFERDGGVRASPLAVSNETLRDLEEHLLMFFTGYSRAADVVLEEQKTKSEVGDRKMVENLHQIKELGLEVEEGARDRRPVGVRAHYGPPLAAQGTIDAMTNPAIDSFYELAMSNGAVGGKLVGAGAGGFLLFYAEDQDALRVALAAEGLTEVRFTFDLDGSVVLVRD